MIPTSDKSRLLKPKKRIAGRAVEVLLVEDNQGDEVFMREVLKAAGFPIHLNVARDGQEALAFLDHQEPFAQSPRPDVILLDLKLPKKSGLEVLVEMRLKAGLENLPVFILTGSREDADAEAVAKFKPADYILKPMDMDHFKDLVKYFRSSWLKTFQAT